MTCYLMIDQSGGVQGAWSDIDSALSAVRSHNSSITNPLVNGWYVIEGWQ